MRKIAKNILSGEKKSAKVTAKVIKNGKGKKLRIYTYKPKKSSSRTMGHRQPYTKLEIVSIA